MSSYVSASLRRLVTARAHGICEYCLMADEDTFFGCQIEHVIAEKHGGAMSPENLAYACSFCNSHKGTDIASLSIRTGQLVRLFNPRIDQWAMHFVLASDGVTLQPLTEIGEVTARILEFNHADRLLERRTLRQVNRYPSDAAMVLMKRKT